VNSVIVPSETYHMTEPFVSKTSHTISALILAAGKGTRMKSPQPKVLHPVMGRPMIEWVMDVAKKAGATEMTLVLSQDSGLFDSLIKNHPQIRIAVQKKQQGTGDAVAAAAAAYLSAKTPSWAQSELVSGKSSKADWVLICAGDTPAMNPDTIREFIDASLASRKRLAILGMNVPEPKGYGRIIKTADGGLLGVTEERDADIATKKITICNSGVIFANVSWLFELLEGISPNNSQKEYYLTDIFGLAVKRGEPAFIFETNAASEFAGVNDRAQLAAIESTMMTRRRVEIMAGGVSISLPNTVYIDYDVTVEPNSKIDSGAVLKGKTRIARDCGIGPQVVLEDAVLGAGVQVGAHAVIIRSSVSAGQSVMPQAVIVDKEI
jgi:bifunctional UDP-N-acetylglucosamine pyrophosphorylase/glucosamine-1-phosphate N-acetyltransferase